MLPPCPLHPPSTPCPLHRAGPQARQVFNFPRRQTISLLGPVPTLLASWPCSSSFPFEIIRCPVPSSPAQRPLGFQLQPRGQSLIQLEWEGFLHFFLSFLLSLPLFSPFYFFISFLDQKQKDRHGDSQKILQAEIPHTTRSV